jgi:hypothetical protein
MRKILEEACRYGGALTFPDVPMPERLFWCKSIKLHADMV